MKLFISGRKNVFKNLRNLISTDDKTIWFHCASLGEFEQGVPIIKVVKSKFSSHKIIVTFFSPSGFEIKKNTPLADVVCYLPLDTKTNARKFIELVHPSMAIFVKYDFWPNYLTLLKSKGIKTYLVSGLFREQQPFFSKNKFNLSGSFMRNVLRSFDHFFVQDQHSQKLLNSIGFENVTVSGDTRFDRVAQQIEIDNSLPFVEDFKGDSLCIVCGSTWQEDEAVLIPYINSEKSKDVKFIIAPHKIDEAKIENFRKKLQQPSVLFSEKEEKDLSNYQVLILDTIGHLTKVYNYAAIAYVGGAMGSSGLHNILEPATFGVPIVIGKNFDKFPEARKLQRLAGLFSVSTPEECFQILDKLITDSSLRSKTGMITEHFINSNTGATKIILDFLETTQLQPH